MAKKRNGEIDLLRFVFSVIIVIHHFNYTYDLNIFRRGYIGVEFFFLISGFLMAKTANRLIAQKNKLDSSEIANTTWSFILKKVKSFYLYYVGAVLLQFVLKNVLLERDGIVTLASKFLRSIPTFTLTFMGLNNNSVNLYVGSTWYLSAMLIAMFLLFPLLLKNFEYFSKLFFPAFSLFVMGYLYTTNGGISNWQDWSGICFNGVLRALGEISFGASLFVVSNLLKEKYGSLAEESKLIRIGFTGIKWFAFSIVLSFAFGLWASRSFNLHAYLFCAVGVLLSFTEIGYCIPESKLTNYLGKISLPIYIFHSVIKYVIVDFTGLETVTPVMLLGMSFLTILLSIGLMYVMDFIKKSFLKLLPAIK